MTEHNAFGVSLNGAPGEGTPGAADSFVLLSAAKLVDPDRPERRYLVEDLVPQGDLMSLIAPAGKGKSLFVLAMCVSLCLGETEFAGKAVNFSGRVLYVDMENSEDDLAERYLDLGVNPGNAPALDERLLMLHLPPLRGLDTPQGAAQMMAAVDRFGITAGDLVVLDSTQRVTEGDENSNDTSRALVRETGTGLKRLGITVIRTDNTGWANERVRGGSSKRDDVGYSFLLVPKSDDINETVFTLKPTKHRGRGSSQPTVLELASVFGRLRYVPTVITSSYALKLEECRELHDEMGDLLQGGLNKQWEQLKAYWEKRDGDVPPRKRPTYVIHKAVYEGRVAASMVFDDATPESFNAPNGGQK